jgi:tetrahydromethanopterin S-methyltransferase subunit H
MARMEEEAERYYVVYDSDNLQITTDVHLYMQENDVWVCEVMAFDSVDEALDALIEVREKIDEEIKKQMI